MKKMFSKQNKDKKRTSIKKGLDFEFSNSNREVKNQNLERNILRWNPMLLVNHSNSDDDLNQLDMKVSPRSLILY